MADLQALIVIFGGLPIDPSILVLQGIAEIFLRVEPFIFDLPAQAPGGAEHGNGGTGDLEVGHMNEAAVGWLIAVEGANRLEAFEPLE